MKRALIRIGSELALLTVAGLFMGMLAPFGAARLDPGLRFPYWLVCIVGGGAIGIVIDEWVGWRFAGLWRRVAIDSLLMTAPVTALVIVASNRMLGPDGAPHLAQLAWQVFVISVAVMAFRALVWRAPRTLVETRTVMVQPSPDAAVAFRRRLSAKRRAARLLAVEAYDHWLRVHTDAGAELITLRFADALAELSVVHGLRVHRSWWVAADAIEDVRWRRGGGEARLAAGTTVPVSRTYAKDLKEAGWF